MAKAERTTPDEVIKWATGRLDLDDALAWIAEGHPLKHGVAAHAVLQAVIGVTNAGEHRRCALRRLARLATQSQLDTGSTLFSPELLAPLKDYRLVLDLLAHKSPTKTLAGLTAEAVAAAQRENPLTLEVFAAIGGLSFRDLKERLGDGVPSAITGRWSAKAVAAVFEMVSSVVCGAKSANGADGAIAMRPVELLLASAEEGGWSGIDTFRRTGVPYHILLAQRTVGSAWGAHRNRTSSKHLLVLASSLCEQLDQIKVQYRRSTAIGGTIRPSEIHRAAGAGSHISLIALGRTKRPVFGVAFSIARDGGTARKNGGRLVAAVKTARLPVALVVGGAGWSARNETAELATAFAGQIYSDGTIEALAQTIYQSANGRTEGQD
ncbi:MAG: hypothetical protein C0504_04160 [Candidatus Solibacter sp.]|nr:hypothetical protein [Candidatus Solibacter sp.]